MTGRMNLFLASARLFMRVLVGIEMRLLMGMLRKIEMRFLLGVLWRIDMSLMVSVMRIWAVCSGTSF